MGTQKPLGKLVVPVSGDWSALLARTSYTIIAMTDELPRSEDREKELPRWLQVPAGLILGVCALLCGFATIDLFLLAPKPISMLGVLAAFLLLLGCIWVLEKCIRLLTGRKRARAGGLLTPNTLRVVAFVMLILPIAGVFTGYYREMGALAILEAVMYLFGFSGLRALARRREAKESQVSDPKDGC
jgi:hypothetical protein